MIRSFVISSCIGLVSFALIVCNSSRRNSANFAESFFCEIFSFSSADLRSKAIASCSFCLYAFTASDNMASFLVKALGNPFFIAAEEFDVAEFSGLVLITLTDRPALSSSVCD